MVSAQQLIQAKLNGSVLSAAFGFDFAFKRALSHAVRLWEADSTKLLADVWTFDDFVRDSYHDPLESDGVPHGLPPHSIPFYAWTTFVPDVHTFEARAGGWNIWNILDMNAQNPELVIPSSTIFRPYDGQSTVRQQCVMKEVDLRPFWFIRSDGGLGIPIMGECPSLWHGNSDFLRSDGKPRTSIKIKFSWPGYEGWERQIRPKGDKGDHSVKRLATLVASKVCAFLSEHDASKGCIGTNPRYVIGRQPGQISAPEVLLLGIVMVSGGAAMPIMRLRDGFAFAF